MDYKPPDSSAHGIFQARILEQIAISCSRGSSDPGIEPEFLTSPALAGGFFTTEPRGEPHEGLFSDDDTRWQQEDAAVKLIDCSASLNWR